MKTITKTTTILLGIVIALACAFAALFLSGCGTEPTYPEVVTEQEAAQVQEQNSVYANGKLSPINERLVYDADTHIVYYKFNSGGGYIGYGYMSPYYGPNGHLCRYDNGMIVEIGE